MMYRLRFRTEAPFLILLLVGICCSMPSIADAEDESPITSALKFTAGVASSALIHEASHAAVAGITGTRMSWEAGTYNQPIGFTDHATSNSKGVAVYSAGLVSQALGAEIILQVDRIDKNDFFIRGMMLWNVLNPILYTLDYWVFRNSNKTSGRSYQGDLQGIEHYSSKSTANAFAVSITALAAFQGYRFLRTQSWAPDWLKGETHKLGLSPLSAGGLMMTYQFQY